MSLFYRRAAVKISLPPCRDVRLSVFRKGDERTRVEQDRDNPAKSLPTAHNHICPPLLPFSASQPSQALLRLPRVSIALDSTFTSFAATLATPRSCTLTAMSATSPQSSAADHPAAEPTTAPAKPSPTSTFTQDEVNCPDGIDYDRVVRMFGLELIDPTTIARVERLTQRPAHLFLKRGLFFAHRDLNLVLDAYEKGEPFYLYTGRGPSRGSLHLGV